MGGVGLFLLPFDMVYSYVSLFPLYLGRGCVNKSSPWEVFLREKFQWILPLLPTLPRDVVISIISKRVVINSCKLASENILEYYHSFTGYF